MVGNANTWGPARPRPPPPCPAAVCERGAARTLLIASRLCSGAPLLSGPLGGKVPQSTHTLPCIPPPGASRYFEGGGRVSLRGQAGCPRASSCHWPGRLPLHLEADVCDPGTVLGPKERSWWCSRVGGWPPSPELWPLPRALRLLCWLPAECLHCMMAKGGLGKVSLGARELERKLRPIWTLSPPPYPSLCPTILYEMGNFDSWCFFF